MVDSERPSPFTIPEPTTEFAEGPPSEPRPSRSMTVRGLIHNLTVFANFYEQASRDIERENGSMKLWNIANHDADTDGMQRDFRATVAIDRVRAYVLAKYGADLTIGTARRLLGDLIRQCGLTVESAEGMTLEAAMDMLDAVESRGNDVGVLESKSTPAQNEMNSVPHQTLRTPRQLLEAFACAAAKFPTCPRMLAFLNSAREDGLITIPPTFVPRREDGQPVIGKMNIGGTGKANFGPRAVFYGIGGVRMASERGGLNVGFVLYGAGNDEAVTKFRELGNEAGVVVHVHDLIRGIQSYDSALVLWSFIVYEAIQGSSWLSGIDGMAENPALHFNPFIASVETLKRLLVRNESPVEHMLAGTDDAKNPGVPALAEKASLTLLRVFTNGIVDDRIEKATRILEADKLAVNEKLTKIDALIRFPATASAGQLGKMLGVTKQAVLKTEWWAQNRKGEKESEVGRRRDRHRKRAKNYEAPGPDEDDE